MLILLAIATDVRAPSTGAGQAAVAPDAHAEKSPAPAIDPTSSATQNASDSNTLSIAGWYVIMIPILPPNIP